LSRDSPVSSTRLFCADAEAAGGGAADAAGGRALGTAEAVGVGATATAAGARRGGSAGATVAAGAEPTTARGAGSTGTTGKADVGARATVGARGSTGAATAAAGVLTALGMREDRMNATATPPATRSTATADMLSARERLRASGEGPGPIVAASAASVDGMGPEGRGVAVTRCPPLVVSTTTREYGAPAAIEGVAPAKRERSGASAFARSLALSKRWSRSAAIARLTTS